MNNNLRCQEVVELITAFLDHALDADTERRVIDHLAQCEGCDQYLAQMRQTVRSLGEQGLPAGRLSPEARAALLQAFRADAPEDRV
jgi:anti-sigma factor RsiW